MSNTPYHHTSNRSFFCHILWMGLGLLWAFGVAGCATSSKLKDETLLKRYQDFHVKRVDVKNFEQGVRLFHRLPLEGEYRTSVREDLLLHLSARASQIKESADYKGMVELFAQYADLFLPPELEKKPLPKAWVELAKKLVKVGEEKGDEARVLASLRLLMSASPKKSKGVFETKYKALIMWGTKARTTSPDPIRVLSNLIEIWQEHVRLFPATDALAVLANLQLKRQQYLSKLIEGMDEQQGPMSQNRMQLKLSGPILIEESMRSAVGVFLQFEELDTAARYLRQLENGLQSDERMSISTKRMLRVVQGIQKQVESSDDDLAALSQEFIRHHVSVAKGLCRMGLRRFPQDFRFPLCMARVASAEQNVPDVIAWYRNAIELSPKERWVHDEALERIHALLEQGLLDPNAHPSRHLAKQADLILAQRMKRWPKIDLPLSVEKLHFMIAKLEMNAGNVKRAKNRLEQSLAYSKKTGVNNTLALRELAFLNLQTSHYEESIVGYKQVIKNISSAADSSVGDSLGGNVLQVKLADARISRDLGESYWMKGDHKHAKQAFEHSLALWKEIHQNSPDANLLSTAHLEEGILLDRLGKHEAAKEAFQFALEADPYNQNIYAVILSHMVTHQTDPNFAFQVWAKAQNHIALESEWKVYYALWLQLIFAHAQKQTPDQVKAVLRLQANETQWWGHLAGLATGVVSYSKLLERATNTGETAEAHFYESVQQLVKGNFKQSQILLSKVLETNMVNFYEFTMARQLLNPMGH